MAKGNIQISRSTATKIGVETPLSYVSCYRFGKKVELEATVHLGNHQHSIAMYLSQHACESLHESLGKQIAAIKNEPSE